MDIHLQEQYSIRLAIEGCAHGTLHDIYSAVADGCKYKGWPGVDLLVIGGDFQAVRNAYDLNCVSMPPKYREMGDFHEYYSGKTTAPYLTVFVGGNHEASNYLFELYYGGWVAPNIYYMGAANVLRLGSLRIAGMSGIWKHHDYRKPHHERLPYNSSDMRSVYHTREVDVRKLCQIRTQVDIGISHDWPQGVEWEGDYNRLFRIKKDFRRDAESGMLGSQPAKWVMDWLRPPHWFSAHLHVKYQATIQHDGDQTNDPQTGHLPPSKLVPSKNEDEIDLNDDAATAPAVSNEDELDLDLDEDDETITGSTHANGKTPTNSDEIDIGVDDDDKASAMTTFEARETNGDSGTPDASVEDARAALPDSFRRRAAPEPLQRPPGITNKTTSFLALSKCLPKFEFLELMDFPAKDDLDSIRPLKLEYDPEWLAITRTAALDEAHIFGDPDFDVPPPKPRSESYELIDKHCEWINQHVTDLTVPENFKVVAPVYDGGKWSEEPYSSPKKIKEFPNPQTQAFCDLLQIPNHFSLTEKDQNSRMENGPRPDPEGERFKGQRSGYRGRGAFGNRGGRGFTRGGRGGFEHHGRGDFGSRGGRGFGRGGRGGFGDGDRGDWPNKRGRY